MVLAHAFDIDEYDVEGLFSVGKDFLMARNQREMASCLRAVLCDRDLADELSSHGRQTILSRHTCGHRVDELLHIHAQLQAPSGTPMPTREATDKITSPPVRWRTSARV